MKIVSYRELEPKDDFMMLMELAFWWPISPGTMEEKIRTDARLKDSPVGFCAVEEGTLAGFVGVMDIPTRTVEGRVETIGGVWAVATDPGFARQGICKTLMEKAHGYFRSKNYRFSFLCTTRALIAYGIYVRMGYAEVDWANQFKGVYKVLDKTESGGRSVASATIDPEKICQLYEKFMQGRTGFVIRQKDFVTMFARRKRFDEKKSIFRQNGYALATENQGVIKVQDLVATDDAAYGELIDKIEQMAQKGVINRSVSDRRLLDLYQSKGYRVQEGDDGVMMVKNLTDAGIDEVYGDSFYIGVLDWF